MIVCLDVAYHPTDVVTGCVGLEAWPDATPVLERVHRSQRPAAGYVPGSFSLRELPFLVEALAALALAPSVVVVDGYVWLGPGVKGLGANLHEAVGVPVVGVAKHPYRGAEAIAVLRGRSSRPLHVTAVGVDPNRAAEHVRAMHGAHRIPTALGRADRLARR